MRLYDLVSTYSWEHVSVHLQNLYHFNELGMAKLQSVYDILCHMSPIDSDMRITIHTQYHGGDLIVSGINGKYNRDMPDYNPTMKGGDTLATYSIAGKSWAEWLGMKIESGSLDVCSDVEIVARCLYEMTRYGYTESDINRNITKEHQYLSSIDRKCSKSSTWVFNYLKLKLRLRMGFESIFGRK